MENKQVITKMLHTQVMSAIYSALQQVTDLSVGKDVMVKEVLEIVGTGVLAPLANACANIIVNASPKDHPAAVEDLTSEISSFFKKSLEFFLEEEKKSTGTDMPPASTEPPPDTAYRSAA